MSPRYAFIGLSATSGVALAAYLFLRAQRKRKEQSEPAVLVAKSAPLGAVVVPPSGIDAKMAGMIDHTLLAPEATEAEILKVCKEAVAYNFASVCVNTCWVPLVARELSGSNVRVCCVVGFPLGAALSCVKAHEAATAVRMGAREVDMVINVGWLKGKRDSEVRADIAAVVQAAKKESKEAIVKVILETTLLSDEEKERGCKLAVEAGADFVKTSTGFAKGGGGATAKDVQLMRRTVGPSIGVKASGGIRDRATAQAMIDAGATRIGASAGIAIVQGGSSSAAY